jgi:lipid II:glycine glycyltransferase (peptidoglycan interpeptide bridge formation enzyme)
MPEESKLADKLENQQKFTEEEMNQVKEIQDNFFNIQDRFGALALAKININQQLEQIGEEEESLEKRLKDNQKTEKKFLDEVTKKYGQGTLNPETGVFTKNNS